MATYRKFDWNRARKDFFTFFDDFFTYNTADWTLTTTEAGAGSASEAVANEPGGQLVVTNDAADNDLDAFQWAGGAGATKETFQFIVGKKLDIVARFKVLEVIQCDLMIGLYITDTDPIGGVSDGLYVRSNDGSAELFAVIEKDAAESTVTMGNLVANTWTDIELYYDGESDHVSVYRDGTRVGALPLTNAPNDEALAVSFVIQNGEAVINVFTMDYIGASQQR